MKRVRMVRAGTRNECDYWTFNLSLWWWVCHPHQSYHAPANKSFTQQGGIRPRPEHLRRITFLLHGILRIYAFLFELIITDCSLAANQDLLLRCDEWSIFAVAGCRLNGKIYGAFHFRFCTCNFRKKGKIEKGLKQSCAFNCFFGIWKKSKLTYVSRYLKNFKCAIFIF